MPMCRSVSDKNYRKSTPHGVMAEQTLPNPALEQPHINYTNAVPWTEKKKQWSEVINISINKN